MIGRVKKFTQEVRAEMEKVTWTSREELWGSTVVVIVSVVLLTLFVGLCDLMISKAIQWLMRWS